MIIETALGKARKCPKGYVLVDVLQFIFNEYITVLLTSEPVCIFEMLLLAMLNTEKCRGQIYVVSIACWI